MNPLIDHYLDGTTSNILTRGVLLGWQRKRPNHAATLWTQTEFAKLLKAYGVTL